MAICLAIVGRTDRGQRLTLGSFDGFGEEPPRSSHACKHHHRNSLKARPVPGMYSKYLSSSTVLPTPPWLAPQGAIYL